MKIAVTGGSGFVGNILCEKLLRRGYSVTILDIVDPIFANNENINYTKVDLLNKLDVENALQDIDVVYHLAGVVLKGMKSNPYLGMNLNVMGTMNILESCIENQINNIMIASSFYVYDSVKSLNEVDESTELNILNSELFGASKIIDELITKRYCEKHNLKYNIFRFGSVYGPGKSSNSIRKFLTNAILNKETEIWGTGVRENQFTFVEDIADGCIIPLEKNIWNETFNLVSPEVTSTKELADLVEDRYGAVFSYNKDKPEGKSFVNMSADKAIKLLRWKPNKLEDCIDKVYNSIKQEIQIF